MEWLDSLNCCENRGQPDNQRGKGTAGLPVGYTVNPIFHLFPAAASFRAVGLDVVLPKRGFVEFVAAARLAAQRERERERERERGREREREEKSGKEGYSEPGLPPGPEREKSVHGHSCTDLNRVCMSHHRPVFFRLNRSRQLRRAERFAGWGSISGPTRPGPFLSVRSLQEVRRERERERERKPTGERKRARKRG